MTRFIGAPIFCSSLEYDSIVHLFRVTYTAYYVWIFWIRPYFESSIFQLRHGSGAFFRHEYSTFGHMLLTLSFNCQPCASPSHQFSWLGNRSMHKTKATNSATLQKTWIWTDFFFFFFFDMHKYPITSLFKNVVEWMHGRYGWMLMGLFV